MRRARYSRNYPQKTVKVSAGAKKDAALLRLLADGRFDLAERVLAEIEHNTSVLENPLDVFPSYIGCFISLRFARFLIGTIETSDQAATYHDILAFLDSIPRFMFPKEVEAFMCESTGHISAGTMVVMIEKALDSINAFQLFLPENQEILEDYWVCKQSDARRMADALKAFTRASGYDEVFLPAMEHLSPAYVRIAHNCRSSTRCRVHTIPRSRTCLNAKDGTTSTGFDLPF